MSQVEVPTSAARTARLELRILQECYLEDFHAIWVDPTATKWTTRGVCRTLEESRARMAGLLADPEKPESLNFGVFIRFPPPAPAFSDSGMTATPPCPATSRMIGVIGIFGSPSPGTVEVGYIYNQSFWGQGYATEALAAYMNVYWSHVKTVDVVIANVDPENTPSVKVLRKCGFEEIGYLVGDIVLPALGKRDTLVFRAQRMRAVC